MPYGITVLSNTPLIPANVALEAKWQFILHPAIRDFRYFLVPCFRVPRCPIPLSLSINGTHDIRVLT